MVLAHASAIHHRRTWFKLLAATLQEWGKTARLPSHLTVDRLKQHDLPTTQEKKRRKDNDKGKKGRRKKRRRKRQRTTSPRERCTSVPLYQMQQHPNRIQLNRQALSFINFFSRRLTTTNEMADKSFPTPFFPLFSTFEVCAHSPLLTLRALALTMVVLQLLRALRWLTLLLRALQLLRALLRLPLSVLNDHARTNKNLSLDFLRSKVSSSRMFFSWKNIIWKKRVSSRSWQGCILALLQEEWQTLQSRFRPILLSCSFYDSLVPRLFAGRTQCGFETGQVSKVQARPIFSNFFQPNFWTSVGLPSWASRLKLLYDWLFKLEASFS